MKSYNLFIIMILIILFNGCYSKPEPEIITRTEVKEVYIPTKPLRPKIKCDFSGSGNEPIAKLLDCLILQKRVIEKITQNKYE